MIKNGILITEESLGELGISSNTEIYVRTIKVNGGKKFLKCRVGFNLFGMNNNYNNIVDPFDPDYCDNYHEVIVEKEEDIIPRLMEKFKKVGDSLWT